MYCMSVPSLHTVSTDSLSIQVTSSDCSYLCTFDVNPAGCDAFTDFMIVGMRPSYLHWFQ